MAEIKRGEGLPLTAVRCQKIAEMREWEKLPGPENSKIGGGKGLPPGAAESCQKMAEMGGGAAVS